jgi:hypothetical protein
MVARNVDLNNDGVVSAKEFKGWLVQTNHRSAADDDLTRRKKSAAMQIVVDVIDSGFEGNCSSFFNSLDK